MKIKFLMLLSGLLIAAFSIYGRAGAFTEAKSLAVNTKVRAPEYHHRPEAEKNKINNLMLSMQIPESMNLSNREVLWTVDSGTGRDVQRLLGRQHELAVPQGNYEIYLQVGKYIEKRASNVTLGRLQQPDFVANFGRLQVSNDALTHWEVYSEQGQAVLNIKSAYYINEILPAGQYTLVASIENVKQTHQIEVARGAELNLGLRMPTSRVNLVATLGDGLAMRPMSWKLYSLDGKPHEIAAPDRHTATLVVPPGRYRAEATLDGRKRSREFQLAAGANANVVLAMD